MLDLGKHNVLGVGVNAIDYDAAVAKIINAGKCQRPMTVTALAVHGIMTGALDPAHRYRLNQFDIVCPDGQPVRWALRWLHRQHLANRVYGPELTLRLCAAAAAENVPIFMFGATEEMLELLVGNLRSRFPQLTIAGCRASRFRKLSPIERDELATEINTSGAGLCFVGLGCPRQEIFAYEMRDHLKMPQIAVGAAFAFHAGLLSQAPPWMQRHGLEWLYRLTREPKRLWRRYLYLNPGFLTLLGLQRLGLYAKSNNDGSEPQDELLFG